MQPCRAAFKRLGQRPPLVRVDYETIYGLPLIPGRGRYVG